MRSLGLVLALALTACGTPVEVKQLSTAQIGYFDAALQAVSSQSETLVLAADTIREQAEAKIDQIRQDDLERLQKVAAETIPGQQPSARAATAQEVLQRAAQSSQTAAEARAKLADNMAAIKAQTRQLQDYIAKMKEVQLALDAYLQSERAGERLVQDVLGQPSVRSLLDTTNDLIPKVTNSIETIRTLLAGLTTGS